MRNALTVAGVELRLFLRDRSNIFFVFIFPLLLVVMIGAQFGEGADDARYVTGTKSGLNVIDVPVSSHAVPRGRTPTWRRPASR